MPVQPFRRLFRHDRTDPPLPALLTVPSHGVPVGLGLLGYAAPRILNLHLLCLLLVNRASVSRFDLQPQRAQTHATLAVAPPGSPGTASLAMVLHSCRNPKGPGVRRGCRAWR